MAISSILSDEMPIYGSQEIEKPTTDINGDQSGENPNMTQYSYTVFFFFRGMNPLTVTIQGDIDIARIGGLYLVLHPSY